MNLAEDSRNRVRRLLPVVLFAFFAFPALADSTAIDLRELELKFKEANLELTRRISTLETQRNVILGLFGVTAFAVPGLYLRLLRKADELAQQRLSEIIESRPDELMKLIKEQDSERSLRSDTRVTIVSKRLDLEQVLRRHGFKNIKTEARGRLDEAFEETGAIVLDLVHGLSEEEAVSIIEEYHLEHVLAFCHDRVTLPTGKATFANSHMTLFNRLLELIKFEAAATSG